MRIRLAALILLAAQAVSAEVPAFVWAEAETPAAVTGFTIKPDSRKAAIYSGGVCFYGNVPKDQIGTTVPTFAYDLAVPRAGQYQLWARLGMEWVRAPLDWRLDGGEWKTYAETELTTSMMSVADWNELAWGRLAAPTLTAGTHRLEVKFERPNKERLLFGLDCFALVADPAWIPEGRLKPGEQYDAELPAPAGFTVPEPAAEAGTRVVQDLTGTWQLARWDDAEMDREPFAPVRELPPLAQLRWMQVQVPGDLWKQRPELAYACRAVYRTTVQVPAGHAGRSAWIHFAGTNYVASVFVNGVYCGGRRSILVPWDCDVSAALKSGQANEVLVVVKSHQYAIDLAGKEGTQPLVNRRNLPKSFYRNAKWNDAIYPSTKGEGDGTAMGIVNPASLVIGGAVYSSDVYVRTSVARKRLDATVEVANPAARPAQAEIRVAAVHDAGNAVVREFPPVRLDIPAGGRATVEVGGDWADAKLWWPSESADERPDCYRLRTTLVIDGRVADVREDLFGFREITISGKDFLLNGVPWRFNNWMDVPDQKRMKGAEDWIKAYHAQNDGYHRFSHDHSRFFGHREAAVATLDRLGVPSRCSTCIDGMFISQNLGSATLWANWEDHLRQVVRAYRNHPSIMHWSIGNEVMLINSHNTRKKEYLQDEQRMAKLVAVVKAEDPTRDSFEDGAGDLGGAGPIDNVHYSWQWWTDIPAQLYAYPTDPPKQRPGERFETYAWDGKRPWMGGEELYWAGRPANVAWFGGPEVFSSNEDAHRAASAYARMAIEGARWQGCAGISPWTDPPTPDASKAFARRAVFVREWNRCFQPGAAFQRTLLLVNDSRHTDPLTLRWQLVFGGTAVAQGEKTYALAPGHRQEDRIAATLPKAQQRLDGELRLEVLVAGKPVFSDTKPVSVLPQSPVAAPAKPLAVVDPKGAVAAWLKARNLPFVAVTAPADLVADAGTVLVGAQAFDAATIDAWAARLREVVAAGGTVIVLEQETPLAAKQLPVALQMAGSEGKKGEVMGEFLKSGGASGSICHPAAPTHLVFAGLQPRDFLTWGGDERNYRLSYSVPAGGGVPLVVAGPNLKYAPMLEVPVGAGSYLLSQVLIGSHLGADPVADRLLGNLLAWAADRAAHPPKPVAVVGGAGEIATALAAINVDTRPAADVAAALGSGSRVIIVPGTAAHLAKLADATAALDAYCAAGNWVLVLGLDQAAVSAFDRLTGITHRLRPFRTEAVRVAAEGDPVLMGITDRDFSQRGYTMIAPWMQLFRVSKQVFTGVVDAGGDITAFSEGLPGQLSDGLRREDFWQYTLTLPSDGSQPIQVRMKQPEAVAAIEVWTSGGYYWPKDVRVTIDGDEASAFTVTLKDEEDKQVIPLPGKPLTSLSLAVQSVHELPSTKELVTFDELRLVKPMPAGLAAKQIPLTTPAGLVKYPRGAGGIVLDLQQLDERSELAKDSKDQKEIKAASATEAENRAKKHGLLASLIRNLGGAFIAAPAPPSKVEKPAPKKKK